MINRKELIKKYIEFFKSKNHKEIPNSSLIPENDPTVLFTTAGMHPLVPFLLGQKHPLGKRLVGIQRCIRTGDIDEVGDATHHTFFEMLGNWSLGDYWKKEAIEYSFEFLTKKLKIPKEKISVTCFKGEKGIPKDSEAAEIWKSTGIKKIRFLGKKDNWWGPAGTTGPCGPDSEMFVNGVEIWNDVFMQYEKDSKGNYNPAKQKNIDTGMGVERTLAILNNLEDNYLTECFKPIIERIEEMSGKDYGKEESITKSMRIIADHIKAATFIMREGITPYHKERGYVLRRLIRRAVVHGEKLGLLDFTNNLSEAIFKIYPDYFPKNNKKTFFVNRTVQQFILDEMGREEMGFRLTLDKGLKTFQDIARYKKSLSGKDAFFLFQSHGFPIELLRDLAKDRKIKIDEEGFKKELKKHKELSRTASAGKFKSGLADNSKQTTKLHTATHLLNEALRNVLKDNSIKQKGSNINSERLRFDFNFPRKLTEEEIKKIENWVNDKIKNSLKVTKEEMPLNKAISSGAQSEFGRKYPEVVSVYTISDDKGKVFSKEICTGPHVKKTSEIGKFKIIKEESSSSGVRRIKAILK